MSRVKGWVEVKSIQSKPCQPKLYDTRYMEEIPEGAIRKEITMRSFVDEFYGETLGSITTLFPPESIGKRFNVILIPVEGKP